MAVLTAHDDFFGGKLDPHMMGVCAVGSIIHTWHWYQSSSPDN
jgi:hypothetical protein